MLLITRPTERAQETAYIATQNNIPVHIDPLFEFHITLDDIPTVDKNCDAILTTSFTALTYLTQHNLIPKHIPLYCPGQSSSNFAILNHFTCVYAPQKYEGVNETIALINQHQPQHISYFHGKDTSTPLSADHLLYMPSTFTNVCFYEMKEAISFSNETLALIKANKITAVTCFSKRMAHTLLVMIETHHLKNYFLPVTFLCLSAEIANIFKGSPFTTRTLLSAEDLSC